MLTESLIRKKFVTDTLREGSVKMEQRWRTAIAPFSVRTGRLRAFGDHPAPERHIGTGYIRQTYTLPLHLRMLDIRGRKQKGGAALYNKVAWPILYKEVLPELRHGFSQEVRQQIRTQLTDALQRRKL